MTPREAQAGSLEHFVGGPAVLNLLRQAVSLWGASLLEPVPWSHSRPSALAGRDVTESVLA